MRSIIVLWQMPCNHAWYNSGIDEPWKECPELGLRASLSQLGITPRKRGNAICLSNSVLTICG